jgi:hypothetical protein
MATVPNKKFWEDVVLDQDRTQVFKIPHQKNIAFQLEGPVATHVGTVSFQGRLEGATKWHDIIPSVTVSAGALIDILAELSDLQCDEVQVLYTFTGGTGTVSGWWSQKLGAR